MKQRRPQQGMDGIKLRKTVQQGSFSQTKSINATSVHAVQQRKVVARAIGKAAVYAAKPQSRLNRLKQHVVGTWRDFQYVYTRTSVPSRVMAVLFVSIFITATVIQVVQPQQSAERYNLSKVEGTLLTKPVDSYAEKLQLDTKTGAYQYNTGYQPGTPTDSSAKPGPKVTASFGSTKDDSAVTVNDPVNNLAMTFTPKFTVDVPKKDKNRVVYPILGMNAAKVYSLGASVIKEDIILHSFIKDELEFAYDVKLPDGLEMRLENDGSIGVYGPSSPIMGSVATATEEDAALLDKARQNAKKDKLIFRIPVPVIIEGHKKPSKSQVEFLVDGTTLTIKATDLKSGNYPLSIDPTVYVETAAKLMRGNNETNIDFDIDNELIQKSQTTGARIDAWSSTSNLSSAVWGQGTAVAGGFIYSVGGVGSTITTTTTFNTAGSTTYVVPAGVTSVTIKAWGAGGGGGGGNGGGSGGNGGGGGYAKAVITVTPAESLNVDVGTGGAKGASNTHGGDGGGFSAVRRSGTYLIQAGGGGGGGGARGTQTGGAGGAGGAGIAGEGSVSVAGSNGGGGTAAGGGGRGTNAAGGTGGTAGATGAASVAGTANAGGNASATATSCATARTGTGGAGGTGAGGDGGNFSTNCANGGGGGGGRFGGGGGGSAGTNNRGGGGGGGGSGLTTGTGTVQTAGSGTNPGNNSDPERGGLGDGGAGATTSAGASAGDNGIVTISYTTPGTVTNSVYWAKFNNTSKAIESPNPGNGTCTGWCTNSSYNLPTALSNLSLVAYNGFLYAIGGSNSSGTPQSTVYIAKLGANGEPQLWHPTGGTKVFWYTDTALSNARSRFGAVAYNNRMYILGGLTTSTSILSSNTVQYADINPTGTLTTWTSTGMQALSPARFGATAQVYNETLYIIGGDSTFNGTATSSGISTVQYSKLNSDGTMNTWVSTSSLSTSGRQTLGGSFSTVFGGYIYVSGGCTTVNSSGYCTAIATDVQLASINADGSLSEWNTIIGLTNDRMAHTMIAWQGGLYRLGGCRAQDASTGGCTDTVLDVDYGVINPDGEASTVATSVSSATAPCSTNNTTCNLPSASVGNMLNATVVTNGYLYIMGGCTNNACTSYSNGVTYQAIGSDGTLQRPASCSGTYSNSYCVSSTTLPTALGAPGVATFNGRIYLVGGFPTITNISYVSVNSDGSIGAWSNTDFTTIAVNGIDDDLSYTFAYARANPSSAGSVPGNLFIFGGCTGTTSGIGCSAYSDSVYKCDIATSGAPSNCTITGQTQIGTVTGGSSSGLGAHAGAVYANYIYLMGGLAPGITDLTTVRYAKFDDNNNVVEADGAGTAAWTEGTNQMNTGRRRGAGFGYNGHLYILGGYDGADAIADIEFAEINVSDGSWGVFDTSSVTIQKRWGLTTVVSNSYAYVVGGCIAGAAPSSCSSRTDTIQTFQVYNNDSGSVKTYSSFSDDTFAADTDRWGASAAVLNGYLYVAGGCISATDCTNATNNVQYALLSTADGSVGTWASATNGLPLDRAWGQLEVVGGYLYYIGGQDDTATNEQSTVYYVGTFSSGNISAAWSTASGALGDVATAGVQTAPRTKFGSTVWNDRIYVVGGLDGSAAVTNTVYISPQLSSGGNIAADSWVSDADVPDVSRFGGAVTAYANNLYMFGGNDGTNYLNDGQFTQINSDGTVDAWTFTTSTPNYISQGDAFAANGYMYIVGGRSAASSCVPNTMIAPISANTTISTGNNPTGVGEWSETNVRYPGGKYGAALAYEKGKLYVMGGGCTRPQDGTYSTGTITQSGTTVTGATGPTVWTDNLIGGTITYADASTATIVSVNSTTSLTVSVSKTIGTGQSYSIAVPRHSYGVLKSQPQVAIYSRMIDTDTDVFPTSWLLNGIDNSIGARWQVKYRSMHDTSDGASQQNPNEDCGTSATMPLMTTWGQETNFGNVTLGNVNSYTAKNSGGSNINCARYYYFYVSIDASKTFGYPEDVNRGPTIADLSLFFTSDPSKRMRFGKTFTGGEQQPLDTPCRRGSAVSGDPNYNCPLP